MGDSVDNRIDEFMQGIPGNEKPVLDEYVRLPNKPDIMPEVLALQMKYGQAFSSVSNKVETLRQETGLTYDEIRERLLQRIRN